MSYSLSRKAYLKLYFHAAKYPHREINGVLVGSLSSDSATIEIVDAIPLLHHWTSLSPMMEIGLDLATQHARSLNLHLVGYYQSSSSDLGPVGERVSSKVREGFEKAVALVIDNQTIGTDDVGLIPFLPHPTSQTGWVSAISLPGHTNADPKPFTSNSPFQLASPSIPAEATKLVTEQKTQEKLGDFDDHLEDVRIDWLRNEGVVP